MVHDNSEAQAINELGSPVIIINVNPVITICGCITALIVLVVDGLRSFESKTR
jgi:hypothetical protein